MCSEWGCVAQSQFVLKAFVRCASRSLSFGMCLSVSDRLYRMNNRVLDTLHMIFTVVEFWHYLIESFGNYEALAQLHWYSCCFEGLRLGLQ